MLDSLDLKSLAETMQRNKRSTRYRWLALASLLVGLTSIMLLLFVTPSPQENRNCNCVAATTILTLLPIIGYFGAIIIIVLNRQSKRKNVKRYAPELAKLNLPSLSNQWLSSINILIVAWGIFWLLSVMFLNLDPFIGFLLVCVPIVVIVSILYWTRNPLRRGNYDEVFVRWSLVKKIPFLHSLDPDISVYTFAGNVAESEKTQLHLLAQYLNLKILEGYAVNNYARGLLYQGRYEEARPLLELAIKIQPEYPPSYESLASWYLYQNQNSERASELSKFALGLTSPFFMQNKKTCRVVGTLTYAWSEARLGHVEKARELLNKALKSADAKNVPYFVLINYTVGETQLALGGTAIATNYFKHAADIDPQGRFGNMARQALSRIV